MAMNYYFFKVADNDLAAHLVTQMTQKLAQSVETIQTDIERDF